MISTRKHGRITVYYWAPEDRGKTYVLGGKKTVRQLLDPIFRHIKIHARIPRVQLHIREFNGGYAIFDREGCRLYWGRVGSTGRAIWQRTAPFVHIEKMHEMTDWNT